MKFAAQTVLFLSSSFAFVKGQTEVCLGGDPNSGWGCYDPDGEYLAYYGGVVSGSIPTEIGQLTGLTTFFLTLNVGVIGTIPTELFRLTNLKTIYLDQNSLSGSIPSELGAMASISHLHINNNQFSGRIPSELGLLPLTGLSLNHNQLTGTIPAELSGLTLLNWCALDNNCFSNTEFPYPDSFCFDKVEPLSDTCEPSGTPVPTQNPTKNPTQNPTQNPTKNPTPSPTYASAPDFDIVLDSCTFTPGTTDVGLIFCQFDGKGGVGHNITSDLYDKECESGVSGGIEQDTTFSSVLESGSQTQEESTFNATISLANSAVPTNATSIDFCLKVEVEDSAGDVYDWIGQKITLNVDLDGSFSTESSLTTTTFDGNTDVNDIGNVTFGVTAYRCDETGETSSDSILELGENFFLCVEGEQDAVIINDITTLEATKDDDTDVALITSGNPNSNTFVYGKQSEKVVVATRLPATFFEDDEVVTLVGSAVIVTGGGTRKLAQVRIMQESPQSADFSMTVEVESSSAASLSAFGVAAAFGLVAALVL